ncbi:MAG: UDP-4-amino-4,6-dideoxy-N-acetyl-beta-L-altrosamine N-acetyltransferase [Gammaproteobacteria bacterium]|nr:MAG: UDP-4-amino-4,6-dideoxy-N-acetyl-beta-L-altrosamine N-acetyltransferase [Gammaproteobacteria bacterium]
MKAQDLEQVLDWRNHPSIRQFMLTQHKISFEEHCAWFEQASKDPTRHLLIFEWDNVPSGFTHFNGASKGGTADWGFYMSSSAPQGTGYEMGKAAIQYAFTVIGLHKICGQVLDGNQASIGFHNKLGFQQEGILREQHLINNKYHDLICFGILENEWCTKKSGPM